MTLPHANDETVLSETDILLHQAAQLWLSCQDATADDAVHETAENWATQSPAHADAWRTASQAWALTAHLAPIPRSNIVAFPRLNRRQTLATGIAAAAACLVMVFAPSATLWLTADYQTGTGETRTVSLADGSTVQLDTASAISVDRFGDTRRVHLLKGRAWFAVAKDKAHPFVVQASDATVTVTGTQFDVRMRSRAVDVSLAEGSVNFTGNGHLARLTPGDHLHYAQGRNHVSRMAIADMAAWRRGKLLVEGDRLSAIVDQIRPYHNGMIWITDDKLARQPVTGVFDLRDPAEALRLAVAPHDGRITRLSPWLTIVSAPRQK